MNILNMYDDLVHLIIEKSLSCIACYKHMNVQL